MGINKYEKFVTDEIKDKIAVLLGKTGVGKSTFINCITEKRECIIGEGYQSCTKKIKHVDTLKDEFNFYFVDTPGLDDTEGDENNIKQLNEIKNKVSPIVSATSIRVAFGCSFR